MVGKAESIDAYSGSMDWDTPFRNVPDSEVGEFAAPGTNAVVADLNAKTSTETRRMNEGLAPK